MSYVAGDFIDAGPTSRAVGWSPALLPVDRDAAAVDGFGQQGTVRPVTPQRQWTGETPTPEAQQACEDSVGIPLDVPAVDSELDAALYELTMEVVQNTPSAEPDVYASCMREAGYSIDESREDFVNGLLDQRVESRPSPEELTAAVADSACRADGHSAVMTNLNAPLSTFEQEHQAQLAALAARPDELQGQARTAAQSIDLPISWI